MPRRLFYTKEELLAEDVNAIRNNYEKLILDRFLSKAVPRIPAFIGGGFKPELDGNVVNVQPGIGLQRVAQTDGSSDIRLMALDAEEEMTFVLPAAGQTKKDLIQARSVLVNEPNANRNFKVGASIVERSTVISQKWSAEVAVKAGVSPDAQGNYNADDGWVPVAVVSLNDTGITALEDARDFYNLFDPDFFSVYGRKNVSFHKAWDGIPLIEVPFEFSDLVEKIDQVSVRRLTKERYGEVVISNKYDTDFSLNEPTASRSTLRPLTSLRFLGAQSNKVAMDRTGPFGDGRYRLSKNNTQWAQGSFGEQDIWGVIVFLWGVWKNALSGQRQQGASDSYSSGGTVYGAFIDDVSAAQFARIPSAGIYITLLNSDNSRWLVYRIPRSRLRHDSNNDLQIAFSFGAQYASIPNHPIAKNSDWRFDVNNMMISTNNPIVVSAGEPRYRLPARLGITDFFSVDNIDYSPDTNSVAITLSAPTSQHSEFPSLGRVWDRVVVKKGTERRLAFDIDDTNIVVNPIAGGRVSATYTYSLTTQDALIKDTDSIYNDFNIEFERLSSTGEDIWRAHSLRPGSALSSSVDYTIVEEGLRTYVRLNSSYPFKGDDELIFSHVIPQELIDAGSGGTPEDQSVATQVAALRASLNALQRSVTTNSTDIATLENASVAGDVSFYHGIATIPGGRSATARGNARNLANLGPVVQAEMNNPAERTEKTISSLLLGGGLVTYNSGATAGYYSPWVAIETSDIGSNSLGVLGPGGDETDLWSEAGNVTVNNKGYTLYVRTTPMVNGKSLRVVFRLYE